MEEGAESILTAAGQEHVIAAAKEFEEEKRKALYDQVVGLNGQYPGGLKEYVARAKKLLQDSANNANPFEGFTPSVPSGEQVDFAPGEYLDKLESEGMEQIGKCGFVLVAGGLGERLGFSSIKVGLPVSILEPQYCYLNYYLDYIQAFSKRAGKALPLCIMTSGDTHDRTVALLEQNNYFKFPKDRITLVKQEKVPALIDNEARFCLGKEGLLDTKPHGHGDIHTLLH